MDDNYTKRLTAINTVRRMLMEPSRRISGDLRDALVPLLEDYEVLAGVSAPTQFPALKAALEAMEAATARALAALAPAAPLAPAKRPSGTRLSAFAAARERRPDGTFTPISEAPGPHVDHTQLPGGRR